jgi:hypothetical protein
MTNSRTAAFSTVLLTALAALAGAAAITASSATVAPAGAEAAQAASCGLSLTPASRNVRRGGKVLLKGRACNAGAASSGGSAVQIKVQKKKNRWATVGKGQTDSSGEFTVCARLSVSSKTKVARIRATAGGATGTTSVRVGKKGANGCEPSTSGDGDGGSGYHEPPADPPANPNCPLSQAGANIGSLTLPSSCTLVGQDTASSADPTPFWGKVDCQTAARHQQIASGGDPHATGLGQSQGNSAFRHMTVQDGDNVWGERCELGLNDSTAPNTLYHEGQRRVTFISLRLGQNVDPMSSDWRTVMQMKQAQTYRNPDMSPIIEVQVRDGEWVLRNSWNDLWSAPATGNMWTRIALDITYSADPSIGSMKMYVDANGDGDASDAGESSPAMHMATLRRETAGSGSSAYAVGESIPDHLRAGVYQNPDYSCPGGCSVDVDNVQVVRG